MEVLSTICSRQKNENAEMLPARTRYAGSHIRKVEVLASVEGKPFYILSGKYGLLHANELVPNYDYYLGLDAVPQLATLIASQLRNNRISKIKFYSEGKQTWKVYENSMHRACLMSEVPIDIIALND